MKDSTISWRIEEKISKSEFIKKLKDNKRKEPLYYDDTTVTESFLVDYQDQNGKHTMKSFLKFGGIPHCIKTLFGHGIYTRKKTMLFNTDLVVSNLFV